MNNRLRKILDPLNDVYIILNLLIGNIITVTSLLSTIKR